MTRAELVARVASRAGLTRAQARRVVDAVVGGIATGLCDARRVEIRGLGTFRARRYPGYTGRNPRTGERVVVAPKVLPAFRPAVGLLDRVQHAPEPSDREEPPAVR